VRFIRNIESEENTNSHARVSLPFRRIRDSSNNWTPVKGWPIHFLPSVALLRKLRSRAAVKAVRRPVAYTKRLPNRICSCIAWVSHAWIALVTAVATQDLDLGRSIDRWACMGRYMEIATCPPVLLHGALTCEA